MSNSNEIRGNEMTDETVVKLADKIREYQQVKLVDKIREYEHWNEILEANYTTFVDDKVCDLMDELIDALGDAGLLVSAADTFGYFPHPDFIQRIEALGLDDEGEQQIIIQYFWREWGESMAWLHSIEMAGVERAIIAYAKLAKQKGFIFEQPAHDLSTVEEHDGWVCVVLRNVHGELARYQVIQTSPSQAEHDDPDTWWRLRYMRKTMLEEEKQE